MSALVFVGCGPFTGAAIGAGVLIDALGDDGAPTVPAADSASVLSQLSVTQFIDSARVAVSFTLTDEESDPASLSAEYLDPTDLVFVPMTFGEPDDDSPANVISVAGASGTIGAATTSPAGNTHSLLWDAEADLGAGAHQDLRVRLILSGSTTYVYLPRLDDAEGDPTDIDNIAAGESPIRVGNDAPSLENVTVDVDSDNDTGSIVVVRFDVSDSTSDTVDVVGFYYSGDGSFDENTDTILDPDDPDDQNGLPGAGTAIPVGSIENLATTGSATEYAIVWDSIVTLGGNVNAAGCRMGVIVQDEYGATTAISLDDLPDDGKSPAFNLAANTAPSVIVTSSYPGYTAIQAFTYSIIDADEDDVAVIIEYSTDDGVTWHPATRAPGTEALSAVPTPSGTSAERFFVWDMLADGLTGSASIVVRARASDQYGIGDTTLSDSFSVNNSGATAAWTRRSALQTARRTPGVAEVNGQLYALGGIASDAPLSVTESYDPLTNSWSSLSDMSAARGYFATATVNGKIYAIGGFDGNSALASVEEFDPATNEWTQLADMPTARYGCAAGVVGGLIYVIGGTQDGAVALDTVEVYDPVADSWTSGLGAMTTARAYLACAVVNDIVYAIGGNDGAFDLNTVEAYDPAGDSWMAKTPMTTTRRSLAVTALDGLIYAFGGDAGAAQLPTTEVYDPLADSWQTKTNMLLARSELAAAVIDQRIYVTGGKIGTTELATTDVYVPTADLDETWTTKASLPADREGPAAAVANGLVYVMGGRDGGGTVQVTTDAYDPAANSWASMDDLPLARVNMAAAVSGNFVYVIGGQNVVGASVATTFEYDVLGDSWAAAASMPLGARRGLVAATVGGFVYAIGGSTNGVDTLNRVERYEPGTDSWTDLTGASPMPTPRTNPAVAVVDDMIYVIGGFAGGNLRVVEAFDPGLGLWTTRAEMPTARNSLVALVHDNKIYAIGGQGGTSAVEVYDPATDSWETGVSMPTARTSLAGGVVDDGVYVVGGRNTSGTLDTNEAFNPLATYSFGHYVGLSDAPVATRHGGFAGDDETLALLYGGFNGAGAALSASNAYIFLDGSVSGTNELTPNDPNQADTWLSAPAMSVARGGHGAANVGGVVYAIGGSATLGGAALSSGERYDLADGTDGAWSSIAAMSTARAHFGCIEAGGMIYALGGVSSGVRTVQCEVYDPGSDSWSAIANLPVAISNAGCVAIDTDIYLFGGLDAGGAPLDTLYVYDTVGDSWSLDPASLPVPLSDVIASVTSRVIWAIGGHDGTDSVSTVYQFSLGFGQWIAHENIGDVRSAGAAMSMLTAAGWRTFIAGGADDAGPLDRADIFYARD